MGVGRAETGGNPRGRRGAQGELRPTQGKGCPGRLTDPWLDVPGTPRGPAALFRGLTSPRAAGGTSPVLTVFQATSSSSAGPGSPSHPAAAICAPTRFPEPTGAARGDDAHGRRAALT